MEESSLSTSDRPDDDPKQEALACYNQIVEAIDVIYEVAAAGSDGALNALRSLADQANTRAEMWYRMRSLKDRQSNGSIEPPRGA